MDDLFWLTDVQMARLEPYCSKSHGKPRIDGRRILSGIIFLDRNGLRWRDALEPLAHTTLYNRWKRWSDQGIFARILTGLAAEHGEKKTVMIDATCLKAHRTASSLAVKRMARPGCKRRLGDGVRSLHKPIRHVGSSAAVKIETRASRSS